MTLRISPDVATILEEDPTEAASEFGGGGPVLYVALLPSGPIHVLAGSALTIWELLDGRTLEGVVETVAALYDIPASSVRTAIRDTIDWWMRGDLVLDDAGEQ